MKYWDSAGAGVWSAGTDYFIMADNGSSLQKYHYTYDPVGNMTSILDTSIGSKPITSLFSYDALNRLITAQASTTIVSTSTWYNSAWSYRVPITASSTMVSEDTHDAYLNMAILPSGVFTHAQASGCDLRMTKADGSTEVPIDLVNYASTTAGQLHFSTGNQLVSNPTYFLYYGNPSASCYAPSATYGAQNVYDTNTLGVWHLETSTSTVGGIIDSTSKHHNGTMYANYTPAANGTAAGIAGTAASFNGTNASIDVPNSTDFLSSAFTLEGWLYMSQYPSTKGEDETAFAKKSSGTPYRSYGLAESSASNNTNGNWFNSAGTGAYAGTFSGTTTATAWHYVVLRHDPSQVGSELSVLTDATTTGTYTASSTGPVFTSDDVLRFGADYDGGARLAGSMDEIRYHNAARSNNYLATRYNNIKNAYTFWSTGAEAASTTASSSNAQLYNESFAYDALGNIQYKSDTGSYVYAGNTGSSYANPDAVTGIGNGTATSTYAYDNNGNLASGGGVTNAWNYLNQLTQSQVYATSTGTSTLSYNYDYAGSRTKLITASSTSYYPNQYFTQTGTTSEKDIYANGVLVASISNKTGSTTTYWNHPDYLGSTNVVSNPSGLATENTTYYPFGQLLSDGKNTAFSESRKYIGQQFDSPTSYDYLNARYYNSTNGRFVSEDPVFLGKPLEQKLDDPQSLDSYSYANNNPITGKDPSGKQWVQIGVAATEGAMFTYDSYSSYKGGQDVGNLLLKLFKPNSETTPESLDKSAKDVFQDGNIEALGRLAGRRYSLLLDGLSIAGDTLNHYVSGGSVSGLSWKPANVPINTIPGMAPNVINSSIANNTKLTSNVYSNSSNSAPNYVTNFTIVTKTTIIGAWKITTVTTTYTTTKH